MLLNYKISEKDELKAIHRVNLCKQGVNMDLLSGSVLYTSIVFDIFICFVRNRDSDRKIDTRYDIFIL